MPTLAETFGETLAPDAEVGFSPYEPPGGMSVAPPTSARNWYPPPAPEERTISPGRRVAAMAVRTGLPIAGGIAGAFVPVPGASYGGAALGGAVGSTLGQLLEGDDLSAAEVALDAALSALPGIKAARVTSTAGRVALRAAEGAGLGVAQEAVRSRIRDRPAQYGTAVLFGGTLGAAGGGIEAALMSRAARRAVPPAADAAQSRVAMPGPVSRTERTSSRPVARTEQTMPPPAPREAGTARGLEYADVVAMSADDLEAAHRAQHAYESNAAIELFGPDGAKRYNLLQRRANGNGPGADAAYAAVREMENGLSKAQQARLFGIGETGYNAEDLSRMAQTARYYDPENIVDSTDDLLMNTVGRELLRGRAAEDANAALMVQGAMAELGRRGFPRDVILDAVRERAAREGIHADDARDLLERSLQAMQGRARRNAPQLGLPDTAGTTGPGAARVEWTGRPSASPPGRPPGASPGGVIPPDVGIPSRPRSVVSTAARDTLTQTPAQPAPADRLGKIKSALLDRVYALPDGPQRAELASTLDEHGDDILAITRGQQPIARMQERGAATVIDPDVLPTPGTAMIAEDMLAHQATGRVILAKIEDAKARVAAGDTGAGSDLTRLSRQLVNVVKAGVGAASESGRTLRVHRETVGMAAPFEAKFTVAALRKGIDSEKIVQALNALPPDASDRQRMQALLDLARPDLGQRALSLRLSNLLLSPKSQQRNIVGNFFGLLNDPVLKPVRAGYEAARSRITGTPQTTFAGEAPRMAAAEVAALPDAFRAWGQILARGFTDEQAKTLTHPGSKFDFPTARFKTRAFNVVGDFMNGADQFFQILNAAGAKVGSAYSTARRELGKGATREALQARMGELMDAPTDGMLDEIQAAATRAVFHEDNPLASWMTSGLSRGMQSSSPLAKGGAYATRAFLVPFVKTPTNLVRRAMQMTPVGFATTLGRQPGRLGDLARTEAAMGTLLAAPVAYYTLQGKVRGNPPQDPAARDAFLAQGPANAMQVGGRWVPLNDLGHLGIYVATVANMTQAAANRGRPLSDDEAQAGVGQALAGLRRDPVGTVTAGMKGATQTVLDATFLQGLGDLYQALTTDDESKLNRYVQRQVVSNIPGQALLREARQAVDPTVRSPRTLAEEAQNLIPGQSTQVPAKLDALGQPIQYSINPHVILDAGPVQAASPVRAELQRLGLTPAVLKPQTELTHRGIRATLTPDEDQTVREAKGQAFARTVERELATAAYRRLPRERQAKRLANLRTRLNQLITQAAIVQKHRGQPVTRETIVPAALR